jgi:hypothetical protein
VDLLHLSDNTISCNPRQLIGKKAREPEVAIWARYDVSWSSGGRKRKVCDQACRCDAANHVSEWLGKPQISIRTRRNSIGTNSFTKLSNSSCSGIDPPDLVPWNSANHNAPSGPKVMPAGVALAVGMVKNVNSPDGVSLATAFRM